MSTKKVASPKQPDLKTRRVGIKIKTVHSEGSYKGMKVVQKLL